MLQGLNEFQGVVEDCCCDYATVDSLNKEFLHGILQKLVKTPFFRYFKVLPLVHHEMACNLNDLISWHMFQ